MRSGHSRSRRPVADGRLRYTLAQAASLLIAATLAGCGSFGDDDGDNAAPSEDEFVARGDEICRTAQREVAEVQRDPPTSRQESVRFAESLIAIFEDEIAQLAALDPPDDAGAAFDRYLDAREEAIALLEEGRQSAAENDAEGYAEAQAEVAAGQVERAERAQEVGFGECSAGPLATSE